LQNFVAIDQTVAEICCISVFQSSGLPPSWICCTHVWTTHEEYLMVFIVVQNLVKVDAVVSVMQVFIFYEFGLKVHIHTPFWGFNPLNGESHQRKPLTTHHSAEKRCMT